ncbi:MAG: hypothetical protein P4L91_13560 [Burkholderiaceae bacterium]|nr:hypothetical protein [Burkholderiaceae bacterium]
MYIVAIGWIYVVLMMSITETSVVAGVMTFLLYGILPLTVILYLLGTPERRRRRQAAENRENPPLPAVVPAAGSEAPTATAPHDAT